MDLLIILTYVAFAWAMFKIFKIPVNKWTIPTAALGGIFIVSGLILLMNYNHPYTFKAQKAVISIPVVPQVTGVVIEVTDKKNTLIKKGEVLFRLDPTRYQARVPYPTYGWQCFSSFTQIRISPSPRLAQLNHGIKVRVCVWRLAGALS